MEWSGGGEQYCIKTQARQALPIGRHFTLEQFLTFEYAYTTQHLGILLK